MTFMTSLVLATLACPIPVPSEPETPWTPSPRREDYSWMSRVAWCERFQRLLQDPARDGARLVFMGDSITQGWTEVAPDVWSQAFGEWKPLRLGIGGDRTQNLLWRVDQGELTGLNPRVLVLLIGINNLTAGDKPDAAARGVKSVAERIHQKLPDTKILLLGILPSGKSAHDPLREAIRQTNEKIAEIKLPYAVYVDLGAHFLHEDGSLKEELMPDHLHPADEGYRVFSIALRPHLKDLLGADVVDVGAIE